MMRRPAVNSALLLLASAFGGSFSADGGAPHQKIYRANQNQNHGPPTRRRPTNRIDKIDKQLTSGYFERNNLRPPTLVSRRGRRAQNTDDTASGNNDESTNGASTSWPSRQPTSELEEIIEDAKYGIDANARLRYDLLWDKFIYDKHSYPYEYVWYNQTTTTEEKTGVPIEMSINFFKVFSVDIVNSMMDLVVWFRLIWVDPRLTWKPEGVFNLFFAFFIYSRGGSDTLSYCSYFCVSSCVGYFCGGKQKTDINK